jgi:hypothetical protein
MSQVTSRPQRDHAMCKFLYDRQVLRNLNKFNFGFMKRRSYAGSIRTEIKFVQLPFSVDVHTLFHRNPLDSMGDETSQI